MGKEGKASFLERVLREMSLKTKQWQREALLRYETLLSEECEHQRLVGNVDEIITKHIPDSLYPLVLMPFGSGTVLDLGTGAGMPGIPLKILLGQETFYLMDSLGRRISFLRRAVHELGLENIFFLHGRAEKFGQDLYYREIFDTVVVRAVDEAAVLVELALPLLALEGKLIIYKGSRGRVEMMRAAASLAICGGVVERDWCYRLPSGEKRTLFLIRKVRPTPSCYPRRPGIPSKRPLFSEVNTNA